MKEHEQVSDVKCSNCRCVVKWSALRVCYWCFKCTAPATMRKAAKRKKA